MSYYLLRRHDEPRDCSAAVYNEHGQFIASWVSSNLDWAKLDLALCLKQRHGIDIESRDFEVLIGDEAFYEKFPQHRPEKKP